MVNSLFQQLIIFINLFKKIIELFGKELEDLFPRNGKPSEYCFLVADLNKTSLLVLINETILSMSLE